MRMKFRRFRERCFPSLKFEYRAIEDEILSTPGWPPVGGDLIVAKQPDDQGSADICATETDIMLLDSSDINNSCSTIYHTSQNDIQTDKDVARQHGASIHDNDSDGSEEISATTGIGDELRGSVVDIHKESEGPSR